jgi:hypothetical protein
MVGNETASRINFKPAKGLWKASRSRAKRTQSIRRDAQTEEDATILFYCIVQDQCNVTNAVAIKQWGTKFIAAVANKELKIST